MKYPNPFSPHVLSADILNRFIDPKSGNLHTIRLIHKTGTMPTWLVHMLKSQEAFVIEESVVDPEKCFMQTRTRNLTHQRFFVAEEVQTYTKTTHQKDLDQSWTLADCQATVKCHFGTRWMGTGLSAKIEGLGVKRFADHFPKSKMALMYILDKLPKNRSENSNNIL